MFKLHYEVWKPVVGYEGLYEVSNYGRVRSVDRFIVRKGLVFLEGVEISLEQAHNGYMRASLAKEGNRKHHLVHRLVAQAFIPNPDNLPQVNHKDENKTNNCVWNLEWCTEKYNVNYGTAHRRVEEKRKVKLLFKNIKTKEEFIVNGLKEAKEMGFGERTTILRALNGRKRSPRHPILKDFIVSLL